MTTKPSRDELKDKLTGGNPDPTHRMASAKVRTIFYLGVLALSVMIYYLVQFRYLSEEANKNQPNPATPTEQPSRAK